MAAAPVEGARVLLWWVDEDGHPLRGDGRRSASARLLADNALAEAHTNEDGLVELPTGPAAGLLVLVAQGGQTSDPWLNADTDQDDAPRIPMDVELVSMVDFLPGDSRPREVVISPFTTLAATLGEHRLIHPSKEQRYVDAMNRAYALLGQHLGGIDLTAGPLPTAEQALLTLDDPARHALALHALSSLAARIARASEISSRGFHTLHLLAALIEDAADLRALMDGDGIDGPISVGACAPPPECDSPYETADASCSTVCDLDANTLRADLASALAFDFLPSQHNHTTLSVTELRPFIEHLLTNPEPELFGALAPAPLDGPAPIVQVGSSPVVDERLDIITFDAAAVPVHTPGEGAEVDLGQEDACPTVGKHIHRLDDVDENPLRWAVTVVDRSGWDGDGDMPVSLQYRVRYRDSKPAAPEAPAPPSIGISAEALTTCNDTDETGWLTDWLSAPAIGSTADGVMFEVVLLQDDALTLTHLARADLEIVFRGQDALGRESVACRCWEHVLLSVPLEIGELVRATGPGSLDSHSLFPGNNLAPLLNGVPPDQGAILASFQLRNGTDTAAYVALSVEQPLVQFTKCWRRTNQKTSDIEDQANCIAEKRCISEFPPDRLSAIFVETGLIEALVSYVRVLDVTTGVPVEVQQCPYCGPGQYRLEPPTGTSPGIYRIELLVADLGALAPRSPIEMPEIYHETALEPPHGVPFTGVFYDNKAPICAVKKKEDLSCLKAGEYRYYRAIEAAELRMASALTVHMAMTPTLLEPKQALNISSLELEAYEWSTQESSLPQFHPEIIDQLSACPVAQAEAY